jgi:hypothetical protein
MEATKRQIGQATMYYRISLKKKSANTVSLEEAEQVTASLKQEPLPVIPDDAAMPNTSISVGNSWKISEDEYLVKIDASPLHASAARRMFGGKTEPKPTAPAPKEEDFIAVIDDAPLHMSLAMRLFGGKNVPKPAETTAEPASNDTAATDEHPSLEEHLEDWTQFWGKMFKVGTAGATAGSK